MLLNFITFRSQAIMLVKRLYHRIFRSATVFYCENQRNVEVSIIGDTFLSKRAVKVRCGDFQSEEKRSDFTFCTNAKELSKCEMDNQ